MLLFSRPESGCPTLNRPRGTVQGRYFLEGGLGWDCGRGDVFLEGGFRGCGGGFFCLFFFRVEQGGTVAGAVVLRGGPGGG